MTEHTNKYLFILYVCMYVYLFRLLFIIETADERQIHILDFDTQHVRIFLLFTQEMYYFVNT